MRKAFNFYRSYYEVAKELNAKDRERFLWALLQKQFEGIDSELDGMAKFAYLSQKHSIDSQVAGYEAKTGASLGGCQGGAVGGSVQEKEEEKEKVEYTIDFVDLLTFINNHTKRTFKTINTTVKKSYKARLKDGYTIDDIKNAILNAVQTPFHKDNNYQYLTPEFFSRASTLDKYSYTTKILDLPPIDKQTANIALKASQDTMNKLISKGYTLEQIKHYAQ